MKQAYREADDEIEGMRHGNDPAFGQDTEAGCQDDKLREFVAERDSMNRIAQDMGDDERMQIPVRSQWPDEDFFQQDGPCEPVDAFAYGEDGRHESIAAFHDGVGDEKPEDGSGESRGRLPYVDQIAG